MSNTNKILFNTLEQDKLTFLNLELCNACGQRRN